ncbi:hypothetical protein ATEIFO6365_0005018800 [Aspergillus terreus]|uniref:Uncharacterized protein n=1 Tax=Aspergillus terreus TaxID=33178 RepID=A0A8H3MPI9_ASPTE|nr:hypothetical protein ATEIFO6365_0005018800 [Aspergillus terreus]
MTDPDKAVVFPGPLTTRPKWTVKFHMANLFETDWNRENGERVRYTMHPHCWLLVGRFLGHDIVKQDLRAFVQAIETYWRADRTLWMPDLRHYTREYACYDNEAPWIRQNCPPCPAMPLDRTHVSASPLIIRDIQRLIARAATEHEKSLGHAANLRPTVADVPAEIIMIIIDTIWQSRPPCHERIHDVRSVMEAFQWRLRDSYWQSRCSPNLVFKVQDVIKAGAQIDWACFCFGLHELLLQEDCTCNPPPTGGQEIAPGVVATYGCGKIHKQADYAGEKRVTATPEDCANECAKRIPTGPCSWHNGNCWFYNPGAGTASNSKAVTVVISKDWDKLKAAYDKSQSDLQDCLEAQKDNGGPPGDEDGLPGDDDDDDSGVPKDDVVTLKPGDRRCPGNGKLVSNSHGQLFDVKCRRALKKGLNTAETE